MQVTCSNCGARYAVDPLAIGPSGRTVQCARCHHRWFQLVEGPRPPPDLVIRPPTPGAGLPAVIKPKPKFPWIATLSTAAAVTAMLAAAAFAFRHEIASVISEAAAGLHASLATAPPPPPTTVIVEPDRMRPQLAQLEIDLDTSRIELVEGRYVVRGEIVNHGLAAGSTRTLRLTFKKNDDVLGARDYALVRGPIAPGARLSFSQALDEPPAGTTDIVPAVE
jgi:predicted Zn finger-like uncharacterized protein